MAGRASVEDGCIGVWFGHWISWASSAGFATFLSSGFQNMALLAGGFENGRGYLAATDFHLGRSTEALKLYEECLEIRTRVLGLEHPDTLQSMNELAVTYNNLGRSMEALKLYEECLEIRKRVLGPEYPDTLQSMNGLAVTYNKLGRLTEALKCPLTSRWKSQSRGGAGVCRLHWQAFFSKRRF